MREALEVVVELQSRYMDLSEFKRVACQDVNKVYPFKVSDTEDENTKSSIEMDKKEKPSSYKINR